MGRKNWRQRLRTRIAAFFREWRRLAIETFEILEPLDTVILVITHILFVFAEKLLTWIGMNIWGKFPERIEPKREPRGTIVLAPGLQQTPFSAYPFGWFLSRVFALRVLLLQTPPQGNYNSFDDMVSRNRWILEEPCDGPLVGIGFSKGGQDLAWLFSTLLFNDSSRKVALVMMSTPLRGSRMAKVVKTRGAQALLPSSPDIRQTLALVHGLHAAGIQMKFFCAVWDRIVRRSDSRPENVEFYRTPTWRERLAGKKSVRPWYWSHTLWLQFGHTAIYNPLAWFQVGWYVSHLIPRL